MKPERMLRYAVHAIVLCSVACSRPAPWWKGNLHTHSLWSDGDDYPEMIVDWYRDNGYHFIALSDHNVLAHGERWVDPTRTGGGMAAYRAYVGRFGADWVTTKQEADTLVVRLKTLEEYRSLFEEPNRFLVIQSEEITDEFESKPIHVNATNILDVIPPQGGESVLDVLQQNVNAVLDQRRTTGQIMFPHVNHPNFGWAVTAEDLIALQGERFFEVYNGHPAVHNQGDHRRPSVERIWDIVLSERLREGHDVLLGIAVDDAHNYHESGPSRSNPGRAWVMVRASTLSAAALLGAMESGDFYGTTGVELDEIDFNGNRLSLQLNAAENITYTTFFIGTRKGYPAPQRLAAPDDTASVRFHYSDEIGTVFAEVAGLNPSYTLTGEELYVRARIVSSKLRANPYRPGEVEQAWTQPFVPRQ